MMKQFTHRISLAVLVILIAALGSFGTFTPIASAQTQVVGSADFRNAPQLVPGTYSDRIVTGDSAWYSLMYTNDTAYEFDVSIQGPAPTGLNLVASFVAPTFTVVDGPASVVSGNGVVYPAGETNVWFLKVTLETTGQDGIEYPVSISVTGVESTGLDACGDVPGCVLDDEYASLNVELAEAEAQLEALGTQETSAAIEAEIENLRGFADSSAALLPGAEARLARNESTMATLCAPDPTCEVFPDQGTKTPLIGFVVGMVALAGGAFKAVRRFAIDPEAVDAPAPKPKTSAIENARREGAANKKAAKKQR